MVPKKNRYTYLPESIIEEPIDMNNLPIITTIEPAAVGLKKVASGKVREIFEVDANKLLFVATDRISAYDVVLENGIPGKGLVLTQLSVHWFRLIQQKFPSLKLHMYTTYLPAAIPEASYNLLNCRSIQVQKANIIPLESIVRGYITGSAWTEYQTKGTVHGMKMPAGLQESQKLAPAIWTPSTKAEAGEHDENISKEQAAELVGAELAKKIEETSLQIYEMAREYAAKRGIIIADTKFEFGLDPATKELVLVDEVLTPDSSRFWPADKYEVGKTQQSYDKQALRDWLTANGLKGKEGVTMPEEIVKDTAERYKSAFEKLAGLVDTLDSGFQQIVDYYTK